MADLEQHLATLEIDPHDAQALASLAAVDPNSLGGDGLLGRVSAARQTLLDRGAAEVAIKLFDLELAAVTEPGARADLLFAKAQLLSEDLLEDDAAVACLREVLALRPGDEDASDSLEQIELVRDNWEKLVKKYVEEGRASTDRQLATQMYLSAGEIYARRDPASSEAELYLKRAIEVDPRNRRACAHLERLLRRQERWKDLALAIEARAEAAATREERVYALIALADVAHKHLENATLAADSMKKVVAVDPSHPRALRVLADLYERQENWSGLIMLYTSALKARPAGQREQDQGIMLQVAMLHWRRLENPDAAEEFFRRIRKTDPANPAALDFYREYYRARGEVGKLLQTLRQAERALPKGDEGRARGLSAEIAELAEGELGNPEKAIDAWKTILRQDPTSIEARAALKRLYRRTEKWNALLDLIKDEIERLPTEDIAGRIDLMLTVVEIYRERLKLDVMVLNTYNGILKLDPENRRALDELALKYRELGRWNDLIAVLSRKAQASYLTARQRAEVHREIAELWTERFGNYAQAVRPLEDLLEVVPDDQDAIAKLKDIYMRRRQWRGLIGLLGKEAAQLEPQDRHHKLSEMARLAAERLGDNRYAIELYNRVLELPTGEHTANVLTALAGLYEREKRFAAVAEIHGRQLEIAGDDTAFRISMLERLGSLYVERLGAPQLAAGCLQQVVEIDPKNHRALRTLRELYAQAGDYAALERLYGALEQWDDLIEVFLSVGDRTDDAAARLAILERAAAIAGLHVSAPDRATRVYERIRAIVPNHQAAAVALVPIYERGEKWSRLLEIYEVLLEHAESEADRLEVFDKIRVLCEQRIGSKTLAYQWAVRAYELAPGNVELLAHLERLGAEADQWEDVARVLDLRLAAEGLDDAERLRLGRELGRIASQRLHDAERARRYQELVLSLAPGDTEALTHLEELATQGSDWPELLRIYRRRVELETDPEARLQLLYKVAIIEEERVADIDAAVGTYHRILEATPGSQRALRALARLEEARGDWAGLAKTLEAQLGLAPDTESQFELLLRLGRLYESSLSQPEAGLRKFLAAQAIAPRRSVVIDALAPALSVARRGEVPADLLADITAALLPVFEALDDAPRLVDALESQRRGLDPSDQAARIELDRRLTALYGLRLGETAKAWDAGLRVLSAVPGDAEIRAELAVYADELGRHEELADAFAIALDDLGGSGDDTKKLATELAQLVEGRLEAPARAESAWRRVLACDATEATAYDALERLYRGGERWQDLLALLEEREAHSLDAARQRDILLSICDLHETVLEDPAAAAASYRRVLDVDPSVTRAYRALERLYEAEKNHVELEALLAREFDELTNDSLRDANAVKRAALRAGPLKDFNGAVDLLEEVIGRRRGHPDARELLEELLPNPEVRLRVARVLEPLYEGDGLWRDLCVVLRAQTEFSDSSLASADLWARIAIIEEEQLSNERGAFETWMLALSADPREQRALTALPRLAPALGRWPDAAAAFVAAADAADPGDLALQSSLLGAAATIYDQELDDTASAIRMYRRLMELDASNLETAVPAARALARLFGEEQRFSELITVLRQQADWADSPVERREHLVRVAEISETHGEDSGAAIAAWRDVLGEDPEFLPALTSLERLFAAADKHVELVEILRRRAELASEVSDKRALLCRIATIHETTLADPQEAISALLEVLDHVPDDAQTLAELSRLYRLTGRHSDLFEVIERRIGLAESDDERAELEFQATRLLSGELDRPREALERLSALLSKNPDHADARSAVIAMLDDVDNRVRAAEVLQPIYESGGEYEALAELLVRVAEFSEDPRERSRAFVQAAKLREFKLEDASGALELYVRAARGAVADPELRDILDDLVRVSAALDRSDELIDVYRDLVPDILDGDLQRTLMLDIADLAMAARGDVSLARDYYGRVLDVEPEDRRALLALEGIYRRTEQFGDLCEILLRKADAESTPPDERTRALDEAARLCAERLARPDDAAMHWERVLELAPASVEAATGLDALYQKLERHHDLVDLLERRLGFAVTMEEAVALRFRLGEIQDKKLRDPDAAIASYSATLGGDPNHEGAVKALEAYLDDVAVRGAAAEVLEPLYVSHQDWPRLIRIYEIKLDAAVEPAERLQISRFIARLHEDQLEDLDGAFRWYARVFREDPDDEDIREYLQRLANILENWEAVANVYQEFLDDQPGDTEVTRAVAAQLAEIADKRLGEVERAQAAYRRVLAVTPDDRRCFAALEDLLVRAERWFALVEVYEDAIALAEDESWRREITLRLARVQEEQLRDANRAVDAFRSVLDIDPRDSVAIAALDRLFREHGRWYDLVDLLNSQLDAAVGTPQEVKLRSALAEVLETRLKDVSAAVEQYEQVLAAPGGAEPALAALERLVLIEEQRERIAEILEPVYRANDWWQKLVVILDARLSYVADAADRVGMLREIASIHERRGGDLHLALAALARAWREDVSDEALLDELIALASRVGAWDDVVGILDDATSEIYEEELASSVLRRIATIHEEQRGDVNQAINAWRRVLELRDDEPQALVALDRLYDATARHTERVEIVRRRAEVAEDAGIRLVMLHRVAALEEETLGRPTDAIATYKTALMVDDTDSASLAALARLYRSAKEWNELAAIVARQIELAEDPGLRKDLRFELAQVCEAELNDAYEAIAQLIAVLDEFPEDEAALVGATRLYERESQWPEVIDVLDRRAALATDIAAAAELEFAAAEICRDQLLEREEAVVRLSRVVARVPQHPGAREALDQLAKVDDTMEAASAVLEQLFRAEGSFDPLAELYERRLAMTSLDVGPAERRELFISLARIHEDLRSDPATAVQVWARALAESPHDADILGELERLAASRGSWAELAEIFEQRIDAVSDADLEYAYAMRLAQLYDEALGDTDRAAKNLRRALLVAPDERIPLAALDRLLVRAGRYPDLAEVLVREADVTLDEAEQAEYLFRLGDLRETRLGDIAGAVSAFRDVLERLPQHGGARAALERLLVSAESERREIVGILEPLFESEGDFARLLEVLAAKLSITADAFDRAGIYARIAEVAEQRLGDPVRALDAVGGWLAEDPYSEQAASELERLGGDTGRWADVAARLRGIVASSESEDVKLPTLMRLAAVQLGRLGHDQDAEASYRAVLELEPESIQALGALAGIYRERGDKGALADTLWRLAGLSFDADKKRAACAEVGHLREALGDLEAARSAWRACTELDEGDREALDHLAAIAEHRGEFAELVEVLSAAARFPKDEAEERGLKTRIARLHGEKLGDLVAAVDAWHAVLDLAPDAIDALASLEDVHTQREDWLAVQEVLTRRLDWVTGNSERISIYERMADVAATHRESIDEAVGYLYQILDVDSSHMPTYHALEQLLTRSERWHDVVELLERLAEVQAARGDVRAELECLARAADVWEGRLENPDAAGEILEKILKRSPESVFALTRLAKIYQNAEDWERCQDVLQRALAHGPRGRDAADLYFRLGEVARFQSGDLDQALVHWRVALQHDPQHASAIAAIEAVSRERNDWATIADMLGRRLASAPAGDAWIDLSVELAGIEMEHLGRVDQALPLLERARQGAPNDARILASLADIYFAAGRYDDAAPIFEALAEEAKGARRMKDVARYRQRLGGILAARGDRDGALAAYEEAFRVNPTDVTTMAGLGALYMQAGDWEKGRRVYRSLVLQNLDESAGITKADVYHQLGVAMTNLGEGDKAKGMFQRGLEIDPNHPGLRAALDAG